MRMSAIGVMAIMFCLVQLAAAYAQSISFSSDIAPILVKRCLACHGEQKFKGEYQLHNYESLRKPGESELAPIVAGKPDESYLLELISEEDADIRMPKDADPLAAEDVALIKKWIAEGASYDAVDAKATLVNVAAWKHPDPPEAYPRTFPVTAVALSPDGKAVAVGGHHEITIWSAEDGGLLRRIKGVAERTYALTYNKDGSRLAAACGTPAQLGEVKLFNPADGSLVQHFGSMSDCAFDVAFGPDEKRLAVCGADHAVRIYNVGDGKQVLKITDHSDWVMGVAWRPDGKRIATASRDKTCKVFDAESGDLITTYADHGAFVYDVAYTSDGETALSCGADNRIHHWIADDPGYEDPKEMKKKKHHQVGNMGGFGSAVHDMVIAGGEVFACSADSSARQYNIEKRNQIRSYSGHQEWLFTVDYCQATKRLATGGLDGQVRIWNTQAEKEEESNVVAFIAAPGYEPAEEATQTSGE